MRFHSDGQPDSEALGSVPCVRHFWLCDTCSSDYLLKYEAGTGVVMRPRLDDAAPQRLVCGCPKSKRSICCLG